MAEDVHQCGEKVRSSYLNIQESVDISDTNKEDVQEFYDWMRTVKEMSDSRIMRYLQTARKVLEHNEFQLRDADEEQIRAVHRQIQDSAYYSKEYSAETKCEYKKFLRAYFKCFNDTDEVPEKADWISTHVKESVKERYNPSELPGPHDIKQVCQEFDNIRDKALLLTHWELGARIGETLSTRVKDVYQEGGKWYIFVRGNKNSPNRNARVKLCPPAIQYWLEHGHPAPDEDDAYLFCKIQDGGKSTGESDSDELAYSHASYRYFQDRLKRIGEELSLDADMSTHNVRRGRFSYLDKKGVTEKMIDKRHGHIIGSSATRAYSRLGDEDANRAYGEAYGEEDNGNELMPDLLPLRCEDCSQVNAGYRDRCHNCNGLLDIVEIEPRTGDEIEQRAMDILFDWAADGDLDADNLRDKVSDAVSLARDEIEGEE